MSFAQIVVERECRLGIGTDLVGFFEVASDYYTYYGQFSAKSLYEFIEKHPEYIGANLWPVTLRLVQQGHLNFVRFDNRSPVSQLWMNYCFFSQPFLEADKAYGVFDFTALGFSYIRGYFKKSVRAINVITDNCRPDNGTGFLLEDRRFVTAKHCIENMQEICIDGWDATNAPLKHIWVFRDTRISSGSEADKRPDLAVLEFAGEPFPHTSPIPGFQLQEAQVLDDVLTMGCPMVPNFDQMVIAEVAQIAAELKSTVGHVVAQETAYLDNQPYLLISARVKGGNSGGPVIGREGRVVGVVVQLAAEEEGRLDVLGYAVVIPTATLKQLLHACDNKSDQVQELPFTPVEHGFKTSK